jgi:hypothetical protein
MILCGSGPLVEITGIRRRPGDSDSFSAVVDRMATVHQLQPRTMGPSLGVRSDGPSRDEPLRALGVDVVGSGDVLHRRSPMCSALGIGGPA